MKTLFIIAVLVSAGYLVYSESPDDFQKIKQWINGGAGVISIESIESLTPDAMPEKPSVASLKKELERVTAEREALYELLARKEALFMEKNQRDQEPKIVEVPRETADSPVMQRRQALIALAERMELQALGLADRQ